MQNNPNFQTRTANSGVMQTSCAGNALPPTNSVYADLEALFNDDEPSYSVDDVLAPFDYEAFLIREGLC